jgi:ElaB/YqjD/DUF883 family membrane-anchored ribosome-binding protein
MATKSSSSPTTDSATESAHETVEQLAQQVAELESRLRKLMSETESGARDKAEQAEQKLKALGGELEQYVAERPVQALGIAFLAGLLLSSWLKR